MQLLDSIKREVLKKSFLTFLKKIMGKAVEKIVYTQNVFVVKAAKERLVSLLKFLQGHLLAQYKSLIDIVVYDNLQTKHRFVVVYNLISVTFNSRLLVRVHTNSLPVPSVCTLYASANWLEREAWDLYGVFFSNHPDLRKILTDYGFNYHPLRKDFPLSGYKEVFYCEKEKRIVHASVELSQAYRVFRFKPPGIELPRG
jgi:NADH:ubiquinone oxidoreductase subunit C